jgi:hypothetical protein
MPRSSSFGKRWVRLQGVPFTKAALVRSKPFTQEQIAERETWPEILAGLRGPEAYEALGILKPEQRRELIQLARVSASQRANINQTVWKRLRLGSDTPLELVLVTFSRFWAGCRL